MKLRLLLCLFILFSGWTSLQAEIKVIPEREYFAVVHDELARAQQSVDITMYLIKLGHDTPQVKTLLDNLWSAQKRGVKVKVVLDDQRENEEAYQYLKEKVSIQFDSPEIKTHAKKIFIDGKRLIIGSSNWTESAFGQNHESNVLVDLEEDKDSLLLLEGDLYLNKLMDVLKECRESLDIVMYLFLVEEESTADPAYQILKEIFRLKKEGIEVRVILDSWEEEVSKNEEIRSLLGLADIGVYYDRGDIATHNKLVIIDGKKVLLGSTNWTRAALMKNRESSLFIEGREIAGRFSDYFEALLKDIPEIELKDRYFRLPAYFIRKGGPLNWLVLKQAEVSLRLYLWLIWEAFNRGKVFVSIEKEAWYEAIFPPEASSRPRYYKNLMINYCLKFLERGGLIQRNQDHIVLLDPGGDKVPWPPPEKDYFNVPAKLMAYGWFKKLSCRALYGYFINLAEFKSSSAKPCWFNSLPRLEKEYNLSRNTISRAFQELMAYNLIEIIHDIPDPGQSFSERKANRYLLNTIYSEQELKMKWQGLEERHGELYGKARDLANSLNEPEDPEVVADIVMLIKIYGEGQVREAIAKARKYCLANGRWEMRYIIGILQHNTPLTKE